MISMLVAVRAACVLSGLAFAASNLLEGLDRGVTGPRVERKAVDNFANRDKSEDCKNGQMWVPAKNCCKEINNSGVKGNCPKRAKTTSTHKTTFPPAPTKPPPTSSTTAKPDTTTTSTTKPTTTSMTTSTTESTTTTSTTTSTTEPTTTEPTTTEPTTTEPTTTEPTTTEPTTTEPTTTLMTKPTTTTSTTTLMTKPMTMQTTTTSTTEPTTTLMTKPTTEPFTVHSSPPPTPTTDTSDATSAYLVHLFSEAPYVVPVALLSLLTALVVWRRCRRNLEPEASEESEKFEELRIALLDKRSVSTPELPT